MQILRRVDGRPSEFDDQWLVEYDPTRPGTTPDGAPMSAHIVCTPDRDKAQQFSDVMAAHSCYTAESGRPHPANRPLTAFHVAIERLR